MIPITGSLTGVFPLPLQSTHYHVTQLHFSARVQGAAPSWFSGLPSLKGTLDMGINGIPLSHADPVAAVRLGGITGTYVNPSTLSILTLTLSYHLSKSWWLCDLHLCC